MIRRKINETPDRAIQSAVAIFAKQAGLASPTPAQGRHSAAKKQKPIQTSQADVVKMADYALAAFDDLTLSEKVELLFQLADGQCPASTHWPLVGQMYDKVMSKELEVGFDTEAIGQAICRAYNDRLTPDQRYVTDQIFIG